LHGAAVARLHESQPRQITRQDSRRTHRTQHGLAVGVGTRAAHGTGEACNKTRVGVRPCAACLRRIGRIGAAEAARTVEANQLRQTSGHGDRGE
jgi:hypothetical protein